MRAQAPIEVLLASCRSITVVGLAKNAGKTTVVNHLLHRLGGRTGLASLGLDGEARDHLTGRAKPRVEPPPGCLVATAEGLVEPTRAVVRRRLGYRTAAGEVVLVEVVPGERVVVSGPALLEQLDHTVEALFAGGVGRVLLEGALDRLGPAAPQRAEAVVLAAGASLANGRDDFALKLRLALGALDLPVCEEPVELDVEHAAGYEAETAERIEQRGAALVGVGGALTGPLLERLLRAGVRTRLVVPDATHLLARPQQVARAGRGGVDVVARRPLAIAAVTASPFHPDVAFDPGEVFATTVEAVGGRWPVHDVVSGRMAG